MKKMAIVLLIASLLMVGCQSESVKNYHYEEESLGEYEYYNTIYQGEDTLWLHLYAQGDDFSKYAEKTGKMTEGPLLKRIAIAKDGTQVESYYPVAMMSTSVIEDQGVIYESYLENGNLHLKITNGDKVENYPIEGLSNGQIVGRMDKKLIIWSHDQIFLFDSESLTTQVIDAQLTRDVYVEDERFIALNYLDKSIVSVSVDGAIETLGTVDGFYYTIDFGKMDGKYVAITNNLDILHFDDDFKVTKTDSLLRLGSRRYLMNQSMMVAFVWNNDIYTLDRLNGKPYKVGLMGPEDLKVASLLKLKKVEGPNTIDENLTAVDILSPQQDYVSKLFIGNYMYAYDNVNIHRVDHEAVENNYNAFIKKHSKGNDDIFNLSAVYYDLLDKNLFQDLHGLIPEDQLAMLSTSHLEAMTVDGKLIGLPMNAMPQSLLFNRALMTEEAKVYVNEPTYENFMAMVKNYDGQEAFSRRLSDEEIIGILVSQRYDEVFTKDGTITEESYQALVNDMNLLKGVMSPDMHRRDEYTGGFKNLTMMSFDDSLTPRELSYHRYVFADDLMSAPYPSESLGYGGSFTAYSLLASNDQEGEALSFMKHLTYNREVALTLLDMGMVPSRINVLDTYDIDRESNSKVYSYRDNGVSRYFEAQDLSMSDYRLVEDISKGITCNTGLHGEAIRLLTESIIDKDDSMTMKDVVNDLNEKLGKLNN